MAGVAFASGLFPMAPGARAQASPEFHFVQMSDTHWGFKGPPNPDAEHTLEKAIVTVNGLSQKPDFIVFTGDLTHTTEDGKERRARMQRFKEIVSGLNVKDVRFLAGVHDASLVKGEAFRSCSATRTGPSTTRACTSLRSTTSPIRRRSWATSSSPGWRPTSSSASPTTASW